MRCRRLLRDNAAAEDATHEVFIRVQNHVEHLPPEGETLRWLRRVATNYCLNELRNRSVRARALEFAEDFGSLYQEETLSAQHDAKRFLAALPDGLSRIAWLTYACGYHQDEMADVLGISRRTVVNRIRELKSRARDIAVARNEPTQLRVA